MAKAKTEATPTVEPEVKETIPIIEQSKVEPVITETKEPEPQAEEEQVSPYRDIEYRGYVITIEPCVRVVISERGLFVTHFIANLTDDHNINEWVAKLIEQAKEYIDAPKR